MSNKLDEQLQQEAKEHLIELAPKGSTLYTFVHAVSRSGMARTLSVYAIKDNKPRYLDGYISRLLGIPRKELGGRSEGLYVQGVGVDVGFHTVYELARVLYNDGYALHQEWL